MHLNFLSLLDGQRLSLITSMHFLLKPSQQQTPLLVQEYSDGPATILTRFRTIDDSLNTTVFLCIRIVINMDNSYPKKEDTLPCQAISYFASQNTID
jgi:hypothetical protein